MVPGLIGPDELSNWETEIHFTDGTISIHGVRAPLRSSESGRPCIDLLDFSGPEAKNSSQDTEHLAEELPKPVDPDWWYVDENDVHYADDAVSHVTDSSSEGEPVPHFPDGFDDEGSDGVYNRSWSRSAHCCRTATTAIAQRNHRTSTRVMMRTLRRKSPQVMKMRPMTSSNV